MLDRFTSAKPMIATRHWRSSAIAMCAAMVTLAASPAEAAKQTRRAQAAEATAPREAGEPIMAIVSIKSQQVTLYDADESLHPLQYIVPLPQCGFPCRNGTAQGCPPHRPCQDKAHSAADSPLP